MEEAAVQHAFNLLANAFHNHYAQDQNIRRSARQKTRRTLPGNAIQCPNRRARTHTQPDRQERRMCAGRRRIKVNVRQAVGLKQDVPLFLASM